MIASYADRDAEKLANGIRVRRLESVAIQALYKLAVLNAAHTLEDLRIPPGNHLEALRGDRKGQYSIRINLQYRICFSWKEGNAYDVEIVDYH